jgi:hypothetical protein
MARSGAPTADAHAIDQIAERQLGECARAGCNEPISTTEKVRMGDEEVFLKIIDSGELQHIRPRALGGTDDISNLEIMCDQCHGMTARTISIPVYLMQQSKRWLDDQDEVRSFTQLVRLSVADYIKTDESHVEKRIHNKVVRELSDAMENIEELREQPDLEKEIINMVVKSGAVFNHPEVARARNTWVDKPHRDKNPSYEKEWV